MRAVLVALAAVVVAVACGSSAGAPPPTASIAGPRPSAVAGRPWTVTLRVLRSSAVPVVAASLGRRSARARVLRRGAGSSRVSLTFAAAGRWRLSARLGLTTVPLGRVRVAAAELMLDQPAQILARDDGTLLVAERGSRDRILRIAADGRARVFAEGLDEPFGLAAGREGTVLVSSPSGIVRLPSRERIAQVDAGPLVETPSGSVVFAEACGAGRIDPNGALQRFNADVEAPHGLVLTRDGAAMIADTGHNRLLRMDPTNGATSVAATGFQLPFGIAEEPGGTLLVTEYGAGRLTRVDSGGGRTLVAGGLRRPYALARAGDGTVYVVEAGGQGRPSGRIARVTPDGDVARLRLRLGR